MILKIGLCFIAAALPACTEKLWGMHSHVQHTLWGLQKTGNSFMYNDDFDPELRCMHVELATAILQERTDAEMYPHQFLEGWKSWF